MQLPSKKPLMERAGGLSLLLAFLLAVVLCLCLAVGNRVYRGYLQPIQMATSLEPSRSERTDPFPVLVNQPSGKLGVSVGVNSHGEDLQVACSTCHAGRPPNPENRVSADLREFHYGSELVHGSVSCLSCHNPDDYDSFRLADGTKIEYRDVMQLCAQCHGPQKRDYDHGVHGGMTGFWDRSQGPQQKLNCVDCHFAHQPKFPQMQPDFKPRDRFLNPSHQTHQEKPTH